MNENLYLDIYYNTTEQKTLGGFEQFSQTLYKLNQFNLYELKKYAIGKITLNRKSENVNSYREGKVSSFRYYCYKKCLRPEKILM